MFGLFRKKSQVELLQAKHAKTLKEAYELSKHNRTKSDQKYAEAGEISDEIARLSSASNK